MKVNMVDFCPVPGTKKTYLHDMKSKVYNFRGLEIQPNKEGKFEIVKDFKTVALSFEEIFPYAKIEKKSAVDPEKQELKKTHKKGKK